MADAQDCHEAILRLGDLLASLDAQVRDKHVPDRTIGCVITDLDIAFTGRVDPDGLHDLAPAHVTAVKQSEVRVSCRSDDLVALAAGQDSFLSAWMHGRVSVSASVRDVLRLRSLIGL